MVGAAVCVGPVGTVAAQSYSAAVFRVMSTTEDAEVGYRFTVDGDVEKTQLGEGGTAADDDDFVSENYGVTVTVTGSTGDEAGDAYLVTGEIVSFERTGGESGLELFLGGTEITSRYLDTPRVFRVSSTTEDAEVAYRFTVDDDVEKARLGDGGTAADDDDFVYGNPDGTVSVNGSTGDRAGDAYRITGDILAFERTGGNSGLELFLDGERVTDQYLDV